MPFVKASLLLALLKRVISAITGRASMLAIIIAKTIQIGHAAKADPIVEKSISEKFIFILY